MRSHVDVVTLVLFTLGGHRRSVDTEEIAVKAHELAPGRFSWRKYPDQINLEMVRVSLSDAKKEANGRLVDGSGNTGWTLTEAGRRWASAAAEELQEDLSRTREEGRGGSIEERRWRSERARLTRLPAWQEWLQRGALKVVDAQAVFRIDIYTVGQLRSRKVARLLAMFEEDAEVYPFLEAAAGLLPDS